MLAKIFAASVALLFATTGGAIACQINSSTPALDETFKTPDPGWGPPDDAAMFSSDGLILKPPVNGSAWRWNWNYSVDGHDFCVTVVNPAKLPPNPGDVGDAGLWFWGRNAQNFYTATFSLNGTVSLDRLVNGVWHIIMAPTVSGAIKRTPGAENEIEVVVKGGNGTFYLNGTKIGDFRGEPPPQGGAPGVYAESGANAIKWVFSRVRLF